MQSCEGGFFCPADYGRTTLMKNEKDGRSAPDQERVQYGYWPFFRAWLIAGTFTGALVLIAKYLKLI